MEDFLLKLMQNNPKKIYCNGTHFEFYYLLGKQPKAMKWMFSDKHGKKCHQLLTLLLSADIQLHFRSYSINFYLLLVCAGLHGKLSTMCEVHLDRLQVHRRAKQILSLTPCSNILLFSVGGNWSTIRENITSRVCGAPATFFNHFTT